MNFCWRKLVLKAFRIIVGGKVQGVGFRTFVQHKAWELGISGTVENIDDGKIRIEAQGDDEKLGEFIVSIEKADLPARPLVKDTDKTEIESSDARKGFKIIRSESVTDELDEAIGSGIEQMILLRQDFMQFNVNTSSNFNTLANRYDKISEALGVLTSQTKQFTDALTTLTKLAKEYFD